MPSSLFFLGIPPLRFPGSPFLGRARHVRARPALVAGSLTGVWVDDRKIASIGVGVRHWITMHGFALNVCGDLSPFDQIVPCGINDVAMTSMEKETGKVFPVADVARAVEQVASHRIKSLRVAPEAQLIDA